MSPNTPVKKAWTEPAIVLISSANIQAPKAHPSVKESTGHVNSILPSYFNSNYNGNAFKGTKLSAAS